MHFEPYFTAQNAYRFIELYSPTVVFFADTGICRLIALGAAWATQFKAIAAGLSKLALHVSEDQKYCAPALQKIWGYDLGKPL